MTHELNQRELIIDLATSDYQINRIAHDNGYDHPIIGPVDYGWSKYSQFLKEQTASTKPAISDVLPATMTWGGGPLAGSRIPGTRRLVFTGYSPQWEGFYISSMGGAAYIMHRVGVDFFCIKNKASQDSVLLLNHRNGEIQVRLEPINPDPIWTGYADPDENLLIGYYALQQAVFDRYASEYDNEWVRVFAVGPASRYTNQGIIGSNQIKKGKILPIDDWAGRGGLGSQLLQYHHIAACIFGGDWEDPDLKDSKEIDSYFQEYYGDSMIRVDLGATEKYRYAPGFMTGGTFGVNMYTADDKLFSFNYQSIYESDQARLDQHTNFILDHYLKQFNEEIIQPKNFAHCGEPCSVACKKYDRIYKKDFEPYQALGPQCGVFDQRAAEKLNHYVDAMGIDAIQMGGTLSWILELIAKGLIDPQEYGLPPADQIRFEFFSDPSSFDIIADSQRNAEYAQKIVSMIIFEPAGAPFRQGIRSAAHTLEGENTHGRDYSPLHYAVYTAHGQQGCMTPNQYWVPGMLSPMPIMGKYFVYYGVEYMSPRELGRKCVERMVYELFSENSGACRFHRKWVETIIDEIIVEHYKIQLDYKTHQFELARLIYELEGGKTIVWENERTVDIIWQYLEKWERFGLKDESLHVWVNKFREDKWSAARAYWEEIHQGIAETFTAGAGSIPDMIAPKQEHLSLKLDSSEDKK
jgi:glyceraldehyde-3-phosphate dehydrogenase (ferredoxin)